MIFSPPHLRIFKILPCSFIVRKANKYLRDEGRNKFRDMQGRGRKAVWIVHPVLRCDLEDVQSTARKGLVCVLCSMIF